MKYQITNVTKLYKEYIIVYIVNMNDNTCGLPSRFKGVKGMLVDTCCETPQRDGSLAPYDLCNIIESPLTESIDLVTIHPTRTLECRRVSSPVQFAKYLSKHRKDLAVKYYFREKDKDEELIQDLLGSLLLRQIYTVKTKFYMEYLTMNYQLQFDKHPFQSRSSLSLLLYQQSLSKDPRRYSYSFRSFISKASHRLSSKLCNLTRQRLLSRRRQATEYDVLPSKELKGNLAAEQGVL